MTLIIVLIDYISNLGFKSNFDLYFKNLNVIGKNDAIYTSNTQIDGMSILKIDTSYPLLKSKDTSKETLTPKVSFRINPGNNMNNYSRKSVSKYFDANNVFNINRLGISNDFEAGRSLTFGLDYKFDQLEQSAHKMIHENMPKDKYLEVKLATVVKRSK